MKLEIACFDVASAHVAIAAGVDRIEFCTGLAVGGLTPDLAQTRALKTHTDIPIFVMIRPHGDGFVYDAAALEQMAASITAFKTIGVDGFVFGILTEQGEVDIPKNKALVALAAPLPCTFHRAFDRTHDPLAALEAVIGCGFTTLLTSGRAPTAVEGIPVLQALIAQAGDRLTVMPGGGVRAANIGLLRAALDTAFFHSSGIPAHGLVADLREVEALLKG
jgi:copper homeostasis protein